MSDSRYRLPEEEFYTGVRIPVDQQVEVYSAPGVPPADRPVDPLPWADGGSGDADGD